MSIGQVARCAAAGVSTFDPLTLSNLALWLKADAGTSSTSDGTALSSWADQSGNTRNVTQATGSKQPLYKAALYNGRPAVRFDGTDDIMDTANFSLTSTVAQVWVVAKWLSATTGTWAVDGTAQGALGVRRIDATRIAADQTSAGFFGPTTTPEALHAYDIEFNGASSTVRVDGSAPNTGNAGSSTAPGGVRLGGRSSLAGYANVDICEVLVCTTLQSAGNRASVDSYLRSRWGTP